MRRVQGVESLRGPYADRTGGTVRGIGAAISWPAMLIPATLPGHGHRSRKAAPEERLLRRVYKFGCWGRKRA